MEHRSSFHINPLCPRSPAGPGTAWLAVADNDEATSCNDEQTSKHDAAMGGSKRKAAKPPPQRESSSWRASRDLVDQLCFDTAQCAPGQRGAEAKCASLILSLGPREIDNLFQALNLSDPAENSQLLNDQLRAMGLYAAPTLGDGNCLFRALSDQLYGTPAYHLRLREEICNWIASHKQRYAPFVDDERGLDVHLECMRQPGM